MDKHMGQDGLMHCSICGAELETFITTIKGRKKVKCACNCITDELKAKEEREAKEERQRNRRICFNGSRLMECTFDTSKDSQKIEVAKEYVNKFNKFYREGKGLLFHGPVGTGKSHLAACIANALIDKGYKVLMTNFATMVNRLQASFGGKQEYIDSLNRYSLLIVDDLGAERDSEYMREQVYNIIDSRYLSGLPMIITTNLTSEELKKPTDIGYARIYDRILERCHPVKVDGYSMRRESIKQNFSETERILKGDDI